MKLHLKLFGQYNDVLNFVGDLRKIYNVTYESNAIPNKITGTHVGLSLHVELNILDKGLCDNLAISEK